MPLSIVFVFRHVLTKFLESLCSCRFEHVCRLNFECGKIENDYLLVWIDSLKWNEVQVFQTDSEHKNPYIIIDSFLFCKPSNSSSF